jgi:hypothetical protein
VLGFHPVDLRLFFEVFACLNFMFRYKNRGKVGLSVFSAIAKGSDMVQMPFVCSHNFPSGSIIATLPFIEYAHANSFRRLFVICLSDPFWN